MSDIHFGTDGWRAIIGSDFTVKNLVRVIDAASRVFKEDGAKMLYIGHDCRLDAHAYSIISAVVAASHGLDIRLTQDYCPTPTLCFSVAHDDASDGGIMLTSSHNAGEYLGVKLRMVDGGASPKEFTDRVEGVIDAHTGSDGMPDDAVMAAYASLSIDSIKNALAQDGKKGGQGYTDMLNTLAGLESGSCASDAEAGGKITVTDLMTPYLESLYNMVDRDVIASANLKVVLDPLYGAARHHLAGLLRRMNVTVDEIDNAEDPMFDGLHPEPIPPWVNRGLERVKELGYDALFTNDGDADRISAGDCDGNFINPHRIITLVTKHLVDKGDTGRVVSTITASAMLERLCKKLGLDYTQTPVGFKWIYQEMEKGDVMIGGEESGGIGIPRHVKERDGLLMALLLCEMMAQTGKDMKALVSDMLSELGNFEFTRKGLSITEQQMETFRTHTLKELSATEIAGVEVRTTDRRDGVKFTMVDDSWLAMRPSGTEPLVRIYAEASTKEQMEKLLSWAEDIVVNL